VVGPEDYALEWAAANPEEAEEAMANERPESTAKEGETGTQSAQAGRRLGGARADFVASLGRKVSDARALLTALEEHTQSAGARDELRRKLHALGAAARLLHFEAMARCTAEAESVLERVAQVGDATERDLSHLAQALDDLPALAWGEAPPRGDDAARELSSGATLPTATMSALIVGGAPLAEALTEEEGSSISLYECERTEHAAAALDLARSLAPDLVIVDSDVDGALDLVEALLDDPLTEPVPIVVVGTFRAAEQAARFVALGVAKTLARPVSPGLLRRACQEVVDQREGRTMRVTLGEPTLEQLGERLAEEVRRALVESVDSTARSCRVPLGEGTEVLGAVWGAIARVREVITMRTDGAVRYSGSGPEGAVAMAPWLHPETFGADRSKVAARGRGAAVDVNLDRRRVIVADDDPGVTWFISDLLRTTGCTVHEALDGQKALEMAYELSPELVVSDILMPGLDGFALCRALKRDVALRDTPVILLSWKEDLLQRVRELGASAAAYLRKESDARAIVARVREVLRPRARVEARLSGEGEVRGRLDGLTVASLLQLVCALRPASRVSVRDASFLYEVEIRDGAPRRATRTSGDGGFQRGERVLAAMLGVGAGRFVVAPAGSGAAVGELVGSLASQLARPIALARATLRVTTGARTMNVERVVLDEDALAGYLLATPQPARDLIKRIAGGASPRTMLLHGDVAPSMLEDVLADLAARGTIVAVKDTAGRDLLDAAVEKALLDPRPSHPGGPTPSPPPASDIVARDLPAIASASLHRAARTSRPSFTAVGVARDGRDAAQEAPSSARAASGGNAGSPSSLEDAVMRAMSDRSPTAGAPTSERPSIVEPSELRPRSSNPPAGEDRRALPSLPPDAVIPGTSSGDMPAARPHAGTADTATKEPADAGVTVPQALSFSGDPSIPITVERSESLPKAADPFATAPAAWKSEQEADKKPSAKAKVAAPPKASSAWRLPALFIAVLAGGGLWLAFSSSNGAPPLGDTTTSAAPFAVSDLPQGTVVAPGAGLLEVAIAPEATLRIDGTEARATREGHRLRVELPVGTHEVRGGSGSAEKVRTVDVKDGRATHVDLESP
jgi:CheY-like chemotaxis protein